MNKIEKEESLNRTIRKVTDNIKILMAGGLLKDPDDGGVSETILEITTNNGNYGPETFSRLVEYIEPKTRREVELEAMLLLSQSENAKLRESVSTEEIVAVPTVSFNAKTVEKKKIHRSNKLKMWYAMQYIQATVDNGGIDPQRQAFAYFHNVPPSTMGRILDVWIQPAKEALAKHPKLNEPKPKENFVEKEDLLDPGGVIPNAK